jgi:hypothetical protein
MEMLRDQPVVELADFLRDVRRKPVRLRSSTKDTTGKSLRGQHCMMER